MMRRRNWFKGALAAGAAFAAGGKAKDGLLAAPAELKIPEAFRRRPSISTPGGSRAG
jgi:hypothetical protein